MTQENTSVELEEVTETSQPTQDKFYTQVEFDNHMAKMKRKYEKKFEELGDIDELKRIRSEYQQKQKEEQLKRGEFDKVIQELASKKDAEIQKRDNIIKEYKINTPLLSAASKHKAINAEQVKSLLINNVRLNSEGEVEVIDEKGNVKYNDSGSQYSVDELVKEFLAHNAHFVSPGLATTHTKSNLVGGTDNKIDVTKLNMQNPKDREKYKEYRKTHGIG